MRNIFAQELTKLASENKRVVLLSGDIGNIRLHRMECPGMGTITSLGGITLSGFRMTSSPIVYLLEVIRAQFRQEHQRS